MRTAAAILAAMCVRVCAYNPLACSTPERRDEISQELRRFHFVGLAGTKVKAPKNTPVTDRTLNHHYALEWGSGRGCFTNSHAGVSILVGSGWGKRHLRATYSPPPSLQGRLGAARFSRGSGQDLLPMVAYFPPKPTKASQNAVYEKTIRRMIEWLYKILGLLPARCCLLLCMDDEEERGHGGGRVKRSM